MLDDNSPDGTGAVADALAAADPQVHVLHRAGKEGLGAAYLAGFAVGAGAGYDAVVEMDADGSHRPSTCRRCSRRSSDADVVIGSRWVPRRLGGQLAGAPQGALASAATSTSRCCSGCRSTTRRPATGSTAATPCGRMGLDGVASQGYCFQTDLTWRAVKRRADASSRCRSPSSSARCGDSKMSRDIMTRVAAPDHRLGRARTGPGRRASWSAAAASRGGTRCERHRRHPVRLAVGGVRGCCAGSSCALLIVPVVEIAAIIAVGRVIGGWQTLLLLVLESLLGAWIVKREGARAWAALQDALRSGRMPSRQLSDAALVLIGGTLLLTPGFVTDIVGFFFILPLTRPITRVWLETVVARRLLGPMGEWPASGPVPGAGRGPGGPASGPAADGRPDVVPGEVVEGTVVDPDRPDRGRRRPGPDMTDAGHPAWGTRHPVAVGQADLRLRRALAARLAQEGEALLEELLELGDRATLEQHVPVGADVLDRLGLGLRAPTELGLRAAAALPGVRDVGLDGEGKLDGVPVRAQVAS